MVIFKQKVNWVDVILVRVSFIVCNLIRIVQLSTRFQKFPISSNRNFISILNVYNLYQRDFFFLLKSSTCYDFIKRERSAANWAMKQVRNTRWKSSRAPMTNIRNTESSTV